MNLFFLLIAYYFFTFSIIYFTQIVFPIPGIPDMSYLDQFVQNIDGLPRVLIEFLSHCYIYFF